MELRPTKMKLTLTNSDSIVVASWKIESDLDLPDMEELCTEFYAAEKAEKADDDNVRKNHLDIVLRCLDNDTNRDN